MKLVLFVFLIKNLAGGIPGMPALPGAGGGGGGSAGITIAPPPLPQEILPPKPIIVAPLLVKQHRKRSRVAIFRSGPTLPPLGFDTPTNGPMYPSFTDFNGFPNYRGINRKLNPNLNINSIPQNLDDNRNLVQQIIMENTSNEDPEYSKKLATAGGPASRWSLSPKFEREKDNTLAEMRYLEYGEMKNYLKELTDKMDELEDSISDMEKSEKGQLIKLNANISQYRTLVGNAKSNGFFAII